METNTITPTRQVNNVAKRKADETENVDIEDITPSTESKIRSATQWYCGNQSNEIFTNVKDSEKIEFEIIKVLIDPNDPSKGYECCIPSIYGEKIRFPLPLAIQVGIEPSSKFAKLMEKPLDPTDAKKKKKLNKKAYIPLKIEATNIVCYKNLPTFPSAEVSEKNHTEFWSARMGPSEIDKSKMVIAGRDSIVTSEQIDTLLQQWERAGVEKFENNIYMISTYFKQKEIYATYKKQKVSIELHYFVSKTGEGKRLKLAHSAGFSCINSKTGQTFSFSEEESRSFSLAFESLISTHDIEFDQEMTMFLGLTRDKSGRTIAQAMKNGFGKFFIPVNGEWQSWQCVVPWYFKNNFLPRPGGLKKNQDTDSNIIRLLENDNRRKKPSRKTASQKEEASDVVDKKSSKPYSDLFKNRKIIKVAESIDDGEEMETNDLQDEDIDQREESEEEQTIEPPIIVKKSHNPKAEMADDRHVTSKANTVSTKKRNVSFST
jgi:hypothetical protein